MLYTVLLKFRENHFDLQKTCVFGVFTKRYAKRYARNAKRNADF